MKDKKGRQYTIVIKDEITEFNYRGTKGMYPTKQFKDTPIENILDQIDIKIAGLDHNRRKVITMK